MKIDFFYNRNTKKIQSIRTIENNYHLNLNGKISMKLYIKLIILMFEYNHKIAFQRTKC